MRKTKKIVALTLATAMIMAPTAVFADSTESTTSPVSDSATGTGSNEGTVDRELFSVVLPSNADNTTTFDFILDPEGLIAEAAANSGSKTAYNGKTFEAGKNLFFKNTNGTTDYSSTSDKLKVINLGTTKVDVALTATAKDVTGGAVFTDDDKATGSATSIYMALNGNDVTTPAAISPDTNSATLTKTIDAVADDCYVVKANKAGDGYELVQKDGFDKDKDGKAFEFWMTGHCNSDATWTGEEKANIEVVWKLTKANSASVTVSPTGLITVSGLTSALNMSDDTDNLTLGVDGNFYNVDWSAVTADLSSWDSTNGGSLTIQLNSGYNVYNNNSTFTVKVKLTDGSVISWTGAITIS